MSRRTTLVLLICLWAVKLYAQDLAGIAIHGFVTQGVLFSSNNNYLTMNSSDGSARWTDGAVNASYSFTDNLRVGIQLHMYQLGQLGGDHLEIDWASGDYRFNDHFGIRAGKVKTPIGLFNDSQDVDAIFLWTLLPQGAYPVDNRSFFLAHVGGELYGGVSLGSRAGQLQYRGYGGQATFDSHGGFVKILTDEGLLFRTPPGGTMYGGDLRWAAPWAGLTLGYSGLVASVKGTTSGGGLYVPPLFVSAEYAQFQKGKFYFAGEYRREPTNAIVTFGPASFSAPDDQRIWFAMGSYRILRKLQAGSYYSHYVNKGLDTALPANYSKDWVVSGRYDFNSYFYGKIEGHFLHGTGLGYFTSTNPNGLKPNSNMLAARIGFSF
jgi:hypothetical protein